MSHGYLSGFPVRPGPSLFGGNGRHTELRIYGLGAADQKGGIAAQLAALETLRAEGRLERANVLVAFTPDEEALSDGMLLTQGHVDFDFDRPYYPPAEQDARNPEIQRFASLFCEVTGPNSCFWDSPLYMFSAALGLDQCSQVPADDILVVSDEPC